MKGKGEHHGKGPDDRRRFRQARSRTEGAPAGRAPRIIAAIAEARAHGDLSENAEYHSAKEQQSLNEGRIHELESLIARAEVIDVTKLSGDTVKFGATVKLVNEDTEEERVWQIVGDSEADAKAGRISISSPLARALIGKKVGATVEVNTPKGAQSYEVLDVRWG